LRLVLSWTLAAFVAFAAWILLARLVPFFVEIYDMLGAQLPLLTMLLVDASWLLTHHPVAVSLAVALAIAAFAGVLRLGSLAASVPATALPKDSGVTPDPLWPDSVPFISMFIMCAALACAGMVIVALFLPLFPVCCSLS
jgi:hypothetical protein